MRDTIAANQFNLKPSFVVGCTWGDEVPFREKGIPTGLQIENYNGGERNPYYHTGDDRISHLNLDYWVEQIKATTAIAAQLALPTRRNYLPSVWKRR
jgi:hypothetical protein